MQVLLSLISRVALLASVSGRVTSPNALSNVSLVEAFPIANSVLEVPKGTFVFFHVMRVLLAVRLLAFWRDFTRRFMKAMTEVAWLLAVLALSLFSFALLGMHLFEHANLDPSVPRYEQFDTFWHAWLSTFQLFTTGNWGNLAALYTTAASGQYTWWYFVLFQIWIQYSVGNLVAATIYEHFASPDEDAKQQEPAPSLHKTIQDFLSGLCKPLFGGKSTEDENSIGSDPDHGKREDEQSQLLSTHVHPGVHDQDQVGDGHAYGITVDGADAQWVSPSDDTQDGSDDDDRNGDALHTGGSGGGGSAKQFDGEHAVPFRDTPTEANVTYPLRGLPEDDESMRYRSAPPRFPSADRASASATRAGAHSNSGNSAQPDGDFAQTRLTGATRSSMASSLNQSRAHTNTAGSSASVSATRPPASSYTAITSESVSGVANQQRGYSIEASNISGRQSAASTTLPDSFHIPGSGHDQRVHSDASSPTATGHPGSTEMTPIVAHGYPQSSQYKQLSSPMSIPEIKRGPGLAVASPTNSSMFNYGPLPPVPGGAAGSLGYDGNATGASGMQHAMSPRLAPNMTGTRHHSQMITGSAAASQMQYQQILQSHAYAFQNILQGSVDGGSEDAAGRMLSSPPPSKASRRVSAHPSNGATLLSPRDRHATDGSQHDQDRAGNHGSDGRVIAGRSPRASPRVRRKNSRSSTGRAYTDDDIPSTVRPVGDRVASDGDQDPRADDADLPKNYDQPLGSAGRAQSDADV